MPCTGAPSRARGHDPVLGPASSPSAPPSTPSTRGPVATDMYSATSAEFPAPHVLFHPQLPPRGHPPRRRPRGSRPGRENAGGRPGYDHEVAGVIAMLCTPDSGWCTGSGGVRQRRHEIQRLINANLLTACPCTIPETHPPLALPHPLPSAPHTYSTRGRHSQSPIHVVVEGHSLRGAARSSVRPAGLLLVVFLTRQLRQQQPREQENRQETQDDGLQGAHAGGVGDGADGEGGTYTAPPPCRRPRRNSRRRRVGVFGRSLERATMGDGEPGLDRVSGGEVGGGVLGWEGAVHRSEDEAEKRNRHRGHDELRDQPEDQLQAMPTARYPSTAQRSPIRGVANPRDLAVRL
ncbi:hypothetical protein MRB53_038160 [Persea americana]|nr:hypothetical protein MRB53_038160 [Persea americana]